MGADDENDDSQEMVPVHLVCTGCKYECVVMLLADKPLRQELLKLLCHRCKEIGIMKLAPPKKRPVS